MSLMLLVRRIVLALALQPFSSTSSQTAAVTVGEADGPCLAPVGERLKMSRTQHMFPLWFAALGMTNSLQHQLESSQLKLRTSLTRIFI